jgi:hypothetical protein
MLMRRGMSPLIATVLLIALAMALGVIVINFTMDSTQDLKDSATKRIFSERTCSLELQIGVLEINNEKYLCYNRTGSMNLEVILENQGSSSASGMRFFLLDANDAMLIEDVLLPLGSHNRTKYNISINETDLGGAFSLPPKKLIISPLITHSDSTVDVCSDNNIDIEEFWECT